MNLRFPGQYFDTESNLHYNYHRYYDPSIGRYLTSDPIGLAGVDPNLYGYGDSVGKPRKPLDETNLYLYTGNSPVNRTDPLGLWYIDLNFSIGLPSFIGGTGGAIISPSGLNFYVGGGLVTPGAGISTTWSPSDPSVGWNVGAQWSITGILAAQGGYSFGDSEDWFWEVGKGASSTIIGGSLTSYYVFPTTNGEEDAPCKQ